MRAYEPELKYLSAEWRHEGSPRRQKILQNPSPVKLMVILACDVQGVILCHYVPHGETVNAKYYAAYLQNHLRRAVRRKRPQLQNAIIFLDNATPHKAICIRNLLRRWRWEVLEHSPYWPGLSPCDYDLIPASLFKNRSYCIPSSMMSIVAQQSRFSAKPQHMS